MDGDLSPAYANDSSTLNAQAKTRITIEGLEDGDYNVCSTAIS